MLHPRARHDRHPTESTKQCRVHGQDPVDPRRGSASGGGYHHRPTPAGPPSPAKPRCAPAGPACTTSKYFTLEYDAKVNWDAKDSIGATSLVACEVVLDDA